MLNASCIAKQKHQIRHVSRGLNVYPTWRTVEFGMEAAAGPFLSRFDYLWVLAIAVAFLLKPTIIPVACSVAAWYVTQYNIWTGQRADFSSQQHTNYLKICFRFTDVSICKLNGNIPPNILPTCECRLHGGPNRSYKAQLHLQALRTAFFIAAVVLVLVEGWCK